jgi:DNA processing protein
MAAEASPRKSRELIAELGSSLFGFQTEALLEHPSLQPPERKRMSLADPRALDSALENGATILTEDLYPEPLKYAEDFVSPALFVKGNQSCLSQPTVGIVGTRNASVYGRACAQKFAEALASRGVTVVSGGALGIDAAAHRGALAVNGSTVAVFAGGIEEIYPSIHRTMFQEIQRNGCLVSQFAAGFRPAEYKFLARNVTVAALSRVLIVIQAPARSGALSTANAAVEMGRDVFVVPANLDQLDFTGSFNLIRDGADLCYHPNQILEALGMKPTAKPQEPSLGEASRKIVQVLGMSPLDTERIATQTGLNSTDVLSELTMLELDGIVLRESGGYILKR